MELKRLTGLRKRQQIVEANRTMFIGVVIASIIVAISLVAAQFLVKQFIFNNKVIAAKSEANTTLERNLKAVDNLKAEVNKLVANDNLSSVPAGSINSTGNNLQVVLDALPTENDPTAVTASFQHAILNHSGVSIENLIVSPAEDVDTAAPVELPFSMVILGNYEQIQRALLDMERVIRPVQVRTVAIQGTDNQLRASIEGVTYYLPAKTVNVTKKTIKL